MGQLICMKNINLITDGSVKTLTPTLAPMRMVSPGRYQEPQTFGKADWCLDPLGNMESITSEHQNKHLDSRLIAKLTQLRLTQQLTINNQKLKLDIQLYRLHFEPQDKRMVIV